MVPSSLCNGTVDSVDINSTCKQLDFADSGDSYEELNKVSDLTSMTASNDDASMNHLFVSIEETIKMNQGISSILVTQQRCLTMKYRELQDRSKKIADLELKLAVDEETRENEVDRLTTDIQKRLGMLRQAEEELHCLEKQKTAKEDEAKQVRAVIKLAQQLSHVWNCENPKFIGFVQTFGELMKSKPT